MCVPQTGTDSQNGLLSREDLLRERRFNELQVLFNLASGGSMYTPGPIPPLDEDLMRRCLAEMEKLVLDTPFSGGGA